MRNIMFTILGTLLFAGLLSFTTKAEGTTVPGQTSPQETSKFSVPDDVKAVLDKSCLPCHGKQGNIFAKARWNYKKSPKLKTHKLVGKLAKIVTKIEEEKMPPPKSVARNNDLELTAEGKKLLIDWAEGLAESLVGE